MKRSLGISLVCAALLAAFWPAAAHATDAVEYQLQLSPVTEVGTTQMIVTVILEPGASLPATVTVPVPAGAEALWVGELLGGAPEADPAREASVTRVGDMDVYEFTLEQSYVGQIELELGEPTIDGTKVTSSLVWTNPGPEVLVTASVVAEAGANRVTVVPEAAGDPRSNDIGETLYPLGGRRLASGDSYSIDVSWRRGGGTFPVLAVVGALLVIALVALGLVLAAQQTRARRASVAPPRSPGV
jgi:hypothetical protein